MGAVKERVVEASEDSTGESTEESTEESIVESTEVLVVSCDCFVYNPDLLS